MTASEAGKLALLWPRDAPKWNAKTPQDERLHRVFEAMAALGIEAEPAIYADDVADQVRQQLLRCDGVLVCRGLGNRRFIQLSYGTANPRRNEPSALASFADKARQGPPYVAGVCHDNGTRPLRSPRADRPLPRRRPNLTIPLFLRESTADWPPSNEPTADASGMAWSGRAGPA